MGLVSKIIGSDSERPEKKAKKTAGNQSLVDGALDTLVNVLQVMGKESFPLESDIDETVFPEICKEFACHVENGAAVPSVNIPQSADGTREWAYVRRFFKDRRSAEKVFVTERLENYRGIVEDLVNGLRHIGERDNTTEANVKESLNSIEDAVSTGVLPQIRETLTQAISQVSETFAKQKQEYENQLSELNERMSSLRQDLVAAREEMKRDPLTDAYNRGAFDSSITQSINMHFVLKQPVTLIMIDLDNFKAVNDTYGHAAGDEVLRATGECLARSFIRKGDLVARYGGDEFAVILNDTAAEHCHQLIERFLKYMGEVRIPYASEDEKVSCSAGYTEISKTDTVECLIKRADQALYQAKAQGRNRAIFLPNDESDSAD